MRTQLQNEKAEGAPEVSHLDPDTQRSVKAIYENGYYGYGHGLGAGGWPCVHKFAYLWSEYCLSGYAGEEFVSDKVRARTDEIAVEAFKNKYDLEAFDQYDISEAIKEFRTIAEKP